MKAKLFIYNFPRGIPSVESKLLSSEVNKYNGNFAKNRIYVKYCTNFIINYDIFCIIIDMSLDYGSFDNMVYPISGDPLAIPEIDFDIEEYEFSKCEDIFIPIIKIKNLGLKPFESI